eukprot:548402_1
MSFSCILVTICNEIIYYCENSKLSALKIETNSKYEEQSLSQSIEKYKIATNRLILNLIMGQTLPNDNDTNNDYNTIDLQFSHHTNTQDWKLFCQKRIGISIGIVVQYDLNKHPKTHQSLLNIFDTIYLSIQKYFIESSNIPAYILRVRCHVLAQRLLFFANHPSLASCDCISSNKEYSNINSDKTMLELHIEEKNKVEIQLEKIKTINSPKPQPETKTFETEDIISIDDIKLSTPNTKYNKPTPHEQFACTESNNRSYAYDYLLKIVLIGDSGTGKSCMLKRFTEGTFSGDYITTIGIDFAIKTIQIDNKWIKLQVWDTSGQQRFHTIINSYYRGAHAIIIVYDITNMESFENVRNWYRQIEQYANSNVQICLVGNKYDMEYNRVVDAELGQGLADELDIDFYETSAKYGNVNTPFIELARRATLQKVACSAPSVTMSAASSYQKSAISMPSISMPEFERKKKEKDDDIPKLIDDVFGDLENMFYLLSDLVYYVMMRSMNGICDFICNLFKFIAW